jgi:hypothetical protein
MPASRGVHAGRRHVLAQPVDHKQAKANRIRRRSSGTWKIVQLLDHGPSGLRAWAFVPPGPRFSSPSWPRFPSPSWRGFRPLRGRGFDLAAGRSTACAPSRWRILDGERDLSSPPASSLMGPLCGRCGRSSACGRSCPRVRPRTADLHDVVLDAGRIDEPALRQTALIGICRLEPHRDTATRAFSPLVALAGRSALTAGRARQALRVPVARGGRRFPRRIASPSHLHEVADLKIMP